MLHDQKWISTTSEILWNIKEKDILTVIVKDYWKSHINTVIYGYCVCGREVQHSAKKIDEKCPLCGATLEWDLSDKKLWHNGKENETI